MNFIEKLKEYINITFPKFGVNKQRELLRLVYEISKREDCAFEDIIKEASRESNRFFNIKKYLLKRRFPEVNLKEINFKRSLPELNINPEYKQEKKEFNKIVPNNVYIEASVEKSDLAKRIQKKYPKANYSIIPNYKNHIKDKKYSLADYNNRLDQFYLTKENFEFYMDCPCSNKSVSCGYHIMKLGVGCPYSCAYCHLQAYVNSPGIVIPANIEDFFYKFKEYKQDIRLGTGQFTDSLAFDHITEYSPLIVNFFRNYPKTTFEFKTKSDNIKLLLETESSGNIMVSWSLNPQKIIDDVEYFCVSLKRRLDAAVKCANAGYKVGFHFDPIIYYNGWEVDYKEVVNNIFDLIDDKKIGWISLGALRMPTALKQAIENRFPDKNFLYGQLLPGYDGKLRYCYKVRKEMFNKMESWIRKRSKDVTLYLCMEEKDLKLKYSVVFK